MNVEAKKSHEKSLAIMAGVILIGAVIFSGIVKPFMSERGLCLERSHELQLKLAGMKKDLLIKDRIDKVYSQIEPLIKGNGTDQQEISQFTRELGNLYSKLNVKIRSVKILPGVNEEFYRRLAIKIEMSGSVKNILNFIPAVETYPDPIRIEQFDLKPQEIADNVLASFLITKVVGKAKL